MNNTNDTIEKTKRNWFPRRSKSQRRCTTTNIETSALEMSEVVKLRDELQKKTKELQESRQEASLAAQIGKTLLAKSEEMEKQLQEYHEMMDKSNSSKDDVTRLRTRLGDTLHEIQRLERMHEDTSTSLTDVADTANQQRQTNMKLQEEIHSLQKKLDDVPNQQKVIVLRAEAAERKYSELSTQFNLLKQENERLRDQQGQSSAVHDELKNELNLTLAKLEQANKKCDNFGKKIELLTIEKQAAYDLAANHDKAHKLAVQDTEVLQKKLSDNQIVQGMLSKSLKSTDEMVQKLSKDNENLRLRRRSSCPPETEFESGSSESCHKGSLFSELSKQLAEEAEKIKEHEKKQVKKPAINDNGSKSSELNLMHEFFCLTAAAIKLNEAGLHNNLCNISNDELYEQAEAAGITFDQYHSWLMKKLYGL